MKVGFNRLANVNNRYQGGYKKVLCVCSAGLLRSPTTAYVLSLDPYNYNTRSAGITEEYALIPIDEVLVAWADEIICMSKDQVQSIHEKFKPNFLCKVISLDIPDEFEYRDPDLIQLIKIKYNAYLEEETNG